MPVVGTPSMWPLSSNDTSAVAGSTEITRLTSLLPLVSPICSPSMNCPLFHSFLNCHSQGAQLYPSKQTYDSRLLKMIGIGSVAKPQVIRITARLRLGRMSLPAALPQLQIPDDTFPQT